MTASPAPEGMGGVPIALSRVSKTFGEDTDKPFLALKEVSAEIRAGEFLSVVGPSGCGKSTLMLMVAGLLKRSSGDIVVGGNTVTKPITDVGIAFQDHLLLDFAQRSTASAARGHPRAAGEEDRGRARALRAAAADAGDAQISRQLSGGCVSACRSSERWCTTRRSF
jgi:ABC-type nitrate/sulfonate/bicarbonate transport system ATPase subunit